MTKKQKSLITGLIVGGAIGSVVSLLFAPEKGEKTREKGKQLFSKGKTKAEQFLEKYKKEEQ